MDFENNGTSAKFSRKEAAGDVNIDETALEEKLVELWPNYRCLYDVNLPEFKVKSIRKQAIEDIAKSLDQSGVWVQRRLNRLRCSYLKATKLQSVQTRGWTNRTPKRRSKWLLDKLAFLDPAKYDSKQSACAAADHVTAARHDRDATSNSCQVTSSQPPDDRAAASSGNDDNAPTATAPSNVVTSQIHATPSSTQAPSCDKKSSPKRDADKPQKSRSGGGDSTAPSSGGGGDKRKREAGDVELIKGLARFIADREKEEEEASSVDAFARYMARTLADFDPRTRNLAQFHINSIIFQAQSGTLGPGGGGGSVVDAARSAAHHVAAARASPPARAANYQASYHDNNVRDRRHKTMPAPNNVAWQQRNTASVPPPQVYGSPLPAHNDSFGFPPPQNNGVNGYGGFLAPGGVPAQKRPQQLLPSSGCLQQQQQKQVASNTSQGFANISVSRDDNGGEKSFYQM